MVPLVAVVALVALGIGVAATRGFGDGGDRGRDEQRVDAGESLGPEPGLGDSGYADSGAGSEADGYGDTYEDTDSGRGSGADRSVSDPTAPSVAGARVVLPSGDGWADEVEDTFNGYFEGINRGDPQSAWMQLSPSMQQRVPLDDLADAVRTSNDHDFVVQDASYSDGSVHAWLQFTSTQDPALGPVPGEGCTQWSLDYVLLEQPDGTFLIDEVAGHGGSAGHSPCQ